MNPFDAFKDTLGLNRQATIITVGGFVVISTAIGLLQRLNDQTVTIWHMLGALVGLILFMMFLAQTPLLVRRGVGSLIAILFSVWAVALVGSVLAPNALNALGISSTHCIATFHFAERCQVSSALAGEGIQPQATVNADTAPAAPPQAAVTSKVPVFIQFAGYQRQVIIDIAEKLGVSGWNVRGATQGGERTANAAGLAEVRYFNSADKPVAEALAASVSAAMNGSPNIMIKDLSNTRYAQAPNSHMEVWIGE